MTGYFVGFSSGLFERQMTQKVTNIQCWSGEGPETVLDRPGPSFLGRGSPNRPPKAPFGEPGGPFFEQIRDSGPLAADPFLPTFSSHLHGSRGVWSRPGSPASGAVATRRTLSAFSIPLCAFRSPPGIRNGGPGWPSDSRLEPRIDRKSMRRRPRAPGGTHECPRVPRGGHPLPKRYDF